MAELQERVPPQSLEAELSVLGSMMIEHEAMLTALEFLRQEDFYKDSHRKVFSSMATLADRGEPVDVVTLGEELRRRGELEQVGGGAFLTQLTNVVPTAANIEYYARIVKEKSVLRRLISASTKIASRAFTGEESVEAILDEAERAILEVGEDSCGEGFIAIKDVLNYTFESLERLYEQKGEVTGLSTGFKDIDNLTSGLQKSDLIIIAARPSMGKTTMALNMAQHIAVEQKKPVAFFSMEMSKEQLAQRLLCAQASIDAHKMRRGFLSADDWPKLTRAVGPLADAPFYIDDTASISVMEMRARARRLKAEKGLQAVFIDYLQLMRGGERAENRQQEISAISRSLKALAKELDVPVVALSQLSRAVEQRNDKRPILSDLLESGGIEANADLVFFIYRDDYYNRESEKKNLAEIILAKQRNGPTGKVELYFMDRYNKFVSLAKQP